MKNRVNLANRQINALEASHHARWTVYSLGFAALVGAIEPFTNTIAGTVSGGLAIAAATGNAVRHGVKYIAASRNIDSINEPEEVLTSLNEREYVPFQYSQAGFSERYNAEVEYLAHRIAKRLNEKGVTELTTLDIDPPTKSDVVAELSLEMFKARCDEGYDLSSTQMCHGFYGAATGLGILK